MPAIQDATALNYDVLAAAEGLDSAVGGGKGAKGILARVGMAVNAAGRRMGMFPLNASFRRDDENDSVRWLEGLARAKELEAACPGTRAVSVCDREVGFQYLLIRARDKKAGMLARARRSARRRVIAGNGEVRDPHEHVRQAEPVGGQTIETPACGGPARRAGRRVRLTLRCLEVDLLPPKDTGEMPLRMLAVSAKEENPPAAVKRRGKALDWLLLTG